MIQTNFARDIMAANLAAKEARNGRMIWGGTVANGATMLALVGLIGNVPDPDAALKFLIAPLLIFMAGTVAGTMSERAYAALGEVDVDASINAAVHESVQSAATSTNWHEVIAAAILLEGRAQISPPDHPTKNLGDAQRRLLHALAKMDARNGVVQRQKRRVGALVIWPMNLSMLALATGVIWIAIAYWAGHRLQ